MDEIHITTKANFIISAGNYILMLVIFLKLFIPDMSDDLAIGMAGISFSFCVLGLIVGFGARYVNKLYKL